MANKEITIHSDGTCSPSGNTHVNSNTDTLKFKAPQSSWSVCFYNNQTNSLQAVGNNPNPLQVGGNSEIPLNVAGVAGTWGFTLTSPQITTCPATSSSPLKNVMDHTITIDSSKP